MASSLGAASLGSVGRGALQCHPARLQHPTAVLQQASRCSISRAASSSLQCGALQTPGCGSSIRRCSSRVQAAADVAAAADQQQQEPQAKQQKQQKQQGKKQQQQNQGGGEHTLTGLGYSSSNLAKCIYQVVSPERPVCSQPPSANQYTSTSAVQRCEEHSALHAQKLE